MRLRADIKVQRKEIQALHGWLDNFATGWAYWGSARSDELPQDHTRRIVEANNAFADKLIAQGNGEGFSTIQVVLPDEKSAMLCKLAWVHASVERPLQGQDDPRKKTIGDQV